MKNWFINLKTRAKLVLCFGSITGLLAITIVIVLWGLYNIGNYFNTTTYLSNFQNNVNVQRTAMLTLLTASDKEIIEDSKDMLKNSTINNNLIISKLNGFSEQNLQQLDQVNKLIQIWNDYSSTRNNEVLPALAAKNIEKAQQLLFGIQNQRYNDIAKLIADMASEEQNFVKAQTLWLSIYFTIALLVALIFSSVCTTVLSASISKPLQNILDVSNKIASGDLSCSTEFMHRKDEMGMLLKSFSLMVKNIKKLIADISEAINIVNLATGDISTSAMQLAASSSETATAISETTGTIEEVRQTAQHSNQRAQAIVEITQKTAEVAKQGKIATEASVKSIENVNAQMELIEQSMQRLSEQTQLIGDILASVDDLAQQSNLLAVNAAIESAKAGEQGKGFSVVAQEIKSLADQSKQATNQVRNILNDIQKATTIAVMATEEGAKVAVMGRQKSNESGESIQVLANNALEAVDSVIQIATVSQQQLTGVEQAAMAMNNIKEASNQNVESTQQLESAAQHLKELGQSMKNLIEKYKI